VNRANEMLIAPTSPLLLVVLVGVPGSGKSTFASELIGGAPSEGRAWCRISQDVLGTRKRCIKVAEAALKNGENLVIDRCNFDQSQRAHWLALRGPQQPTWRLAVYLPLSEGDARDRVLGRGVHEGGVDTTNMSEEKIGEIVSRMHSSMCPPVKSEGFDERLLVSSSMQRDAALGRIWSLAAATSEAA
jgi:predicted kinase